MSKRKRADDSKVDAADQSPVARSAPVGDLPRAERQLPRSYADTDSSPAPPGPYSYTAEKRETLYRASSRHQQQDEHGRGDHGHGSGPRESWQRKGQRKNRRTGPQVNPQYGQLGAFPEPESDGQAGTAQDGVLIPGTGIAHEQEEEDQAATEAWAYLRSVRAEADGLPTVFHAGTASVSVARLEDGVEEEDGPDDDYAIGDEDGSDYDEETYGHDEHNGAFFSDGAWVAGPTLDEGDAAARERGEALSAQQLYYDALRKRFVLHRERMRSLTVPPGHSSMTARGEALVRTLFNKSNTRHGERSLVLLGPPTRELVASLDNVAVLALIKVLDDDLDYYADTPGKGVPAVVLGPWAWVLLGRLSDVGELGSEEVGVVRDLGKRAGLLLCRLRVAGQQQDGIANGVEQEAINMPKPGETVETEDGPGKEHRMPDDPAMAILHLIITVAGEFYGQRDLLPSRLPWINDL